MNATYLKHTSVGYRKFVRTPVRIASVFCIVLDGCVASKIGIANQSAYWAIGSSIVLMFPSLILATVLSQMMIRDRMWLWGKKNFKTWAEFQTWMKSTPGDQLEEAAKNPNWTP